MLDNFNLKIEQRAAILESYIDALTEFAEENEIDEFEELIPKLHPITLNKLKNEFYEKNYFPGKKIENSLKDFF